jgi:hypothetical protein
MIHPRFDDRRMEVALRYEVLHSVRGAQLEGIARVDLETIAEYEDPRLRMLPGDPTNQGPRFGDADEIGCKLARAWVQVHGTMSKSSPVREDSALRKLEAKVTRHL